MKRLHNVLSVHSLLLFVLMSCLSQSNAEEPSQRGFRELQRYAASEAHQAVAVDETSFYAISSREIARYQKSDGKQITKWTGPKGSHIRHLNSGTVIDGKLYCAHSNWPASPLENTVEVFDAKTLKHLETLKFPDTEGAINWIDRRQGAWWIAFAFYGDLENVRKTRLVRYDDQWQPNATFTFPDSVLKRFLPNSNSGGAWGPNGLLYTTGHDRGELYVLRVPESEGTLEHVETLTAPITGQGIAWDRRDIGTLFGIHRAKKEVLKLRLTHAKEYAALRDHYQWTRNLNNPILPPRPAGNPDSKRCMNPWVIRDGNQYRLYYAGGDDRGTHRISLATASVNEINKWDRKGPVLETGQPGSFDARWTVLPHVIQASPNRLHLYYTGNSGKGAGLSAFPGLGLATSSDGLTWKRHGKTPVIAPSGEPGSPDAIGIAGGSVLQIKQADGSIKWLFYYTGCPTIGKPHLINQQKTICLATSDDGIQWNKQGTIMQRDPNRDYENVGVAGPVVRQRDDGTFQMWYSAIGSRWGYYCICYAESDDGIFWKRGAKYGENLQLEPAGTGWDGQMVEYPSIIRENNRFRMFFCGNRYGNTGIGTALSSEIEPQK